jgi:hypothetical protein
MRPILAAALLIPCLSIAALAQRSLGYWFVAPGGRTSSGVTGFDIHMGGGGELALGKGVSAGIELGAVGLRRDYTNSVQGVVSANGYYHFQSSHSARWDPFVTGGYSLFFRRGASNLGNFGGGVNYWFANHVAVRLELRDHSAGGANMVHYWGARLGLSFTQTSP